VVDFLRSFVGERASALIVLVVQMDTYLVSIDCFG